jgi:3-hydroxyacyl-CoA dehydrogenase
MGPLTLADFIGLDVCVNILDVLQGRARRRQVPRLPAAAPDGRCRPSRPQDG